MTTRPEIVLYSDESGLLELYCIIFFQAYIQAKSRGAPVIEDPEPRGVRMAERRIDIQPAEDEEDPDDGLSIKHISHSRFEF